MEDISKNSAPAKERSAYWDNIKGLLMFLTVFAHCLYENQEAETVDRIVNAIYMFHMPAFVFVSGYFGKSERARGFKAIAPLIFAYFVFNSFMGIVYGFESLLKPMNSYWYIPALIFWRLTAHRLAGFKDIELILIAAALFAGFYPSVDNTFAAARIIAFYPFYMAGYKLTAEASAKFTARTEFKKAVSGIAAALGAALSGIFFSVLIGYSDDSYLMFAYSTPDEAAGRIGIYITSFLAIYALRALSEDKKVPLLTMLGRNSLAVFIIHRPLTLIFGKMCGGYGQEILIPAALGVSAVLCAVFGNDAVSGIFNKFINAGADIITGTGDKNSGGLPRLAASTVSVCIVLGLIGQTAAPILGAMRESGDSDEDIIQTVDGSDKMFRIMSNEELAGFEGAFRITFAGDLICLEDQVKRACTEDGYNFDDVFEYAAPHISSADLAIGVFEGPMAGKDAGYSSSNFDDGKELAVNFPDEFADAVKKAGFDLVTSANNHLLDKGLSGALRTADILDEKGQEHTGVYRSADEKNASRVKIVEKDGIKFAVLSYTYGCNDYSIEMLETSGTDYITSFISGTEGETFEKLKAAVENDFDEARKYSPDLIIVLPHIGTQFSNGIDEEQKVWFDIFKENGADIILGDHPHAVEPVLIENTDGRTVFTAYCPGNFANIYREKQGDTSALIDVYIDRTSKNIIGGGIVPLYTQSPADGNYRALPLYDINYNKELRLQLCTDDIERAEKAHSTVTRVMLGSDLGAYKFYRGGTSEYLFDENGFIRVKTTGLDITDEMRAGTFYKKLTETGTVCFIGDSVTEGTKNGGCPWYEPLEEFISADISSFSKGSTTISYFTERASEIPSAELYVIAVGTNDVRYRDASVCAMTAEEYTAQISVLKDKLKERSPSAEFVFIAPWYSIDGDPFCSLSFEDKTSLNAEYGAALEKFCDERGDIFIDPNGYIKDRINVTPCGTYLIDHIHPNASDGVIMYCEAVLNGNR